MKQHGLRMSGFGHISLFAFMGVLAGGSFGQNAWAVIDVNGRKIEGQRVSEVLGAMPTAQRSQFLRDPQARQALVTNLVNEELLVQEGEKAKLDQDADYKKALEQFRRNYLAGRVLDANLSKKVSDSAARKFYSANLARYTPDRAEVQHILAGTESEARGLLAKLQAKDADFQTIAEKFSKDPSAASNRGAIGVISRDGPFAPEFVNAVFDAPTGKIVGPVKSQFGFHLIKVVNKRTAVATPFEEIELKVKADLRASLAEDFLNGLRKAARVSVDDAALGKL